MVISDVDFAAWSVVVVWSAVNHRVNLLAHSDAGTFRSVAHVRGNISSRNVEPCHTMLKNIGNVNAAASFLGIVASNLATGNGDMGAVIGSKSSSTVATRAIRTAEFRHSIIRDIAARNGHDAALGHNAATESLVECAITGDYATGHLDRRPPGIYTAATRSAVARDHATGNAEGRIVLHFNSAARTRARSTTHIAAAHGNGRAVLGIDQAANATALFLCDNAALKIECATLAVVVIQIDEL